tara:strand:- start:715 stop:897 length:183 start_codon:yes stop_codon:yes gene_type:complete
MKEVSLLYINQSTNKILTTTPKGVKINPNRLGSIKRTIKIINKYLKGLDGCHSIQLGGSY